MKPTEIFLSYQESFKCGLYPIANSLAKGICMNYSVVCMFTVLLFLAGEPLVQITDRNHQYFNRVATGGELNCASPCHTAFFPPENRQFATFWIGVWSLLCLASSLVTVLTFLVDQHRFQYPERPIIFLSFCYLMISVGYVLRLVLGHDRIACDGKVVRHGSTGPAQCSLVFLLLYFFGMASSLWWVVLTVTWFLAAGLKWGSEAIARYSQLYHFAAWFLPGAKSLLALTLSAVDGDNIAGLCYVGNTSLLHLRLFVLAPLCVYLLLGIFFLLSGFVSLFRIRSAIKAQGEEHKTDRLEKLMVRIGVFSVLYCVPATLVIGCHFYEQHSRSQWELALTCPPCGGTKGQAAAAPEYAVFMLKYFMSLVVGITSGFWVWTGKTLHSWRQFLRRLACCCCCCRMGAVAAAGASGGLGRARQQQLLLASPLQHSPLAQAPLPLPPLTPAGPLLAAPSLGLTSGSSSYQKFQSPDGSMAIHSTPRQKLLSNATGSMSHV